MMNKEKTPPQSLIRAREIGKEVGLKHIYCGNLPFSYANYERTVCQKCGKTLVERAGFSITENKITDGKCKFCKAKIKGVWE